MNNLLSKPNQTKSIYKSLLLLLFCCPFLIQAQNCTVNAGVDQTVCAGTSVIQEGNIGGSYVANTLNWVQVSGPNTATITNKTSVSPTFSGLITGSYIFRISNTCQVGGIATDDVTITVNPAAIGVTATGSFPTCYTPGTAIQLTGVQPAGHTLLWSAVSSAGGTATFNGSVSSSFSGSSPTIQVPAPLNTWCSSTSSSVIVKLTSTNNTTGCKTETTSTFTFNYNLGPIDAFAPASVCGTCVNLLGSCPQNGTGLWTVVSGPNTPTFSSANSSTTTACNLVSGTYVFRWTVSGASACNTGFKDVSVNVNAITSSGTAASAGATQVFCPGTIPSVITLRGNLGLASETITWTQLSGAPVTIVNPNSPLTSVTGVTEAGAPYIFRYTKSASGCSTTDTVSINIAKDAVGWNDINQNACFSTTGSPFGYSILYSVPTGTFPNRFASQMQFKFTYLSGPSDTIGHQFDLYYNPFSIIPGGDPSDIEGQFFYLGKGQTQTSNVYTADQIWPYQTNNSDLVLDDNIQAINAASCTSPRRLRAGTYVFRTEVITPCSTYSKLITINTGLSPVTLTAGTDQLLPCNQKSTTLAGSSLNCNLTPSWKTIKKPAGATDPINSGNINNSNAPLSGLIDGTYEFVWSASAGPNVGTSGSCVVSNDTVKIVVASAVPVTPTITGGGTTGCLQAPVNLTGRLGADALNGTWTVTSVPAGGTYTITPDVNTPTIQFIPTTANTTYTLTWTVVNGCGSSLASTTVTSTSTTAVVPNITTNNCQVLNSFGTLSATPSPTPTGLWTSSNPNYTLATPNATSTTVGGTLNAANGAVTFYYTLDNTATGGCGSIKDSVTFFPSGGLAPLITVANQCDVVTYPIVVPVTFSNIIPYVNYNLVVSGPGGPVLSSNNIFVTGNSTQNVVVNVTITEPGSFTIGTNKQLAGACSITNYSAVKMFQISTAAPTAIAGSNIVLCGATNTSTLAAQPATFTGGASGLWTVETIYDGVAPTITNGTQPNATITFNGGGYVRLKWSTFGSNAACGGGSVDYVDVKYIPTANAGTDKVSCFTAPVTNTSIGLSANAPDPSTGSWSLVSGPNVPIFSNVAQSNATISNLIAGTYVVRWTIAANGGCPATTDDVNILVSNNCNTVLPITIKSFTGTTQNCEAKLNWTTTNEQGFNYFEIERSVDGGIKYDKIAKVDYNINNTIYNYIDISAAQGKNFYRIKMLDKNGDFKYSNIVVLDLTCSGKEIIRLYPNPAKDYFYLYLNNLASTKSLFITLLNNTGQIILQQNVRISSIEKINTSNLNSGVYYLRITDADGKIIEHKSVVVIR